MMDRVYNFKDKKNYWIEKALECKLHFTLGKYDPLFIPCHYCFRFEPEEIYFHDPREGYICLSCIEDFQRISDIERIYYLQNQYNFRINDENLYCLYLLNPNKRVSLYNENTK